MRKMWGIAATAGLVVSGSAGAATAAMNLPNDDGCPGEFQLVRVIYLQEQTTNEDFDRQLKAADENGDGYLCYLPLENAPLFDPEPTFLYGDNSTGFGDAAEPAP